MDLQLTSKTVLITGGSKGIGRAAAQVLSDEGCNLILVARTRDTLEAAAAEIRASRQVNVRVIAADLSSDAAVRRVAEEAGEIDILVNNAGAIPPGDIAAVNDETWRRAWDLKVFGFISFCRAVYPRMAARRCMCIIFKKKPFMCLKVASRSALATRSITSTRAALPICHPRFHMPSST